MSAINTEAVAEANQGLGGRLPLLMPEQMTDRQRRLYDNLAPAKRTESEHGGFVAVTPQGALIGPFNSYLYVPDISDGYIAWLEAQHEHLPFTPEVREAVILTVGAAWDASFELYAHRAVARSAGLPADTIEALATGAEPNGLSMEARIARDFTQALVIRHEVDGVLYTKAQDIFGDAGLVAMTHLIGLYMSVSAVLKAFQVPAPDSSAA